MCIRDRLYLSKIKALALAPSDKIIIGADTVVAVSYTHLLRQYTTQTLEADIRSWLGRMLFNGDDALKKANEMCIRDSLYSQHTFQ